MNTRLIELLQEDNMCKNEEAAIAYYEENYQGEHDSLEDWAYNLAEELGELKQIPKPYINYIDWESLARDSVWGGDIFSIELDGKHHVFWNR